MSQEVGDREQSGDQGRQRHQLREHDRQAKAEVAQAGDQRPLGRRHQLGADVDQVDDRGETDHAEQDDEEADEEHAVEIAGDDAHAREIAALRRCGSSRPNRSNFWSSQIPNRGSGTLRAARRNIASEIAANTPNGSHRPTQVGDLVVVRQSLADLEQLVESNQHGEAED